MAYETEIVAWVNSQTYLAGKLAGRVYPNVLPQEPTLPALVYNRIATNRKRTISSPASLIRVLYQFDIYATTRLGANDIARAIVASLEAYRGQSIMDTENIDEADFYEPDTQIYGVRQDWYLWFEENKL